MAAQECGNIIRGTIIAVFFPAWFLKKLPLEARACDAIRAWQSWVYKAGEPRGAKKPVISRCVLGVP